VSAKQDMGALYQLTKRLWGILQTFQSKTSKGHQLAKEEDILKCWREHFEKILSRNDQESEVNNRKHITIHRRTIYAE
jgi:hypothetical protein